MAGPYRTQADTGEAAPPRELAYHPEQRGPDSSAVAMMVLFAPLAIGVAIAALGLPDLALPGMLVFGLALYFESRRRRRRPQALLSVDGAVLSVKSRDALDFSVPFDDLLDVRLDTKTIQRVMESPGPVPDLRFINAKVGSEIDTARIELVRRDDSVFLTDDYLSHTDSTEWATKMRRFLRKHGWVPADERDSSGA